MVVVSCPGCAARYRIPEKLRGKKVKCKKCGDPFRIGPPPEVTEPKPELQDDLLGALADGEAQARDPATAPPPPPPAFPTFPGTESSASITAETTEQRPTTGIGTYLSDVGKSLLFFTHGGDLVTFVIVAIIVALQVVLSFAGCLGLLGVIIINGWYMAFRLSVVAGAAAGEDNLPNFTIGEPWEGIVLPLLKWLAAWIAALAPFVLGVAYLVLLAGQLSSAAAVTPLLSALVGDFVTVLEEREDLGVLVGGVLLLIPMALWPMMLLVVTLGGIRSLVRFDLMMATILKTLPSYVLVVILTYAGVVAPALIPSGESLGLHAAIFVIVVYANIFTMRVIGLYYHHFKHKFAWSWG